MDGAAPEGRAKRKQATHEALVEAARDLFNQFGFRATTVQQISEAAKVSERTFFRYFESKDDLLLTDVAELFEDTALALAARPLDEVPLDAIRQSVSSTMLTRNGRSLLRFGADLDPRTSAHSQRLVRLFIEWEERLAQVLLGRAASFGADPSDAAVQLSARVTALAGVAAFRAATLAFRSEHHVRPAAAPGQFARYLDESFALVKAGCPAPPGRARGRSGRGLGTGST